MGFCVHTNFDRVGGVCCAKKNFLVPPNEDYFELPAVICFRNKPSRRWFAGVFFPCVEKKVAATVGKTFMHFGGRNVVLLFQFTQDVVRDDDPRHGKIR